MIGIIHFIPTARLSPLSAQHGPGRHDGYCSLHPLHYHSGISVLPRSTDPATDEDGAKVGSFPFTTIAPNIGRGYIAVPDPAPALGLHPEDCRPSYGHALAFDPEALNAEYSNVAPLRAWTEAVGWPPAGAAGSNGASGGSSGGAGSGSSGSGGASSSSCGSGAGSNGPAGRLLWRCLPVTLKDVAGLVPGAYKASGRHARFAFRVPGCIHAALYSVA